MLKQRYANHRERVKWWREKTKNSHQHFAVCSTSLKVTAVDIEYVGHFVSIGFEPGLRAYAFISQENRDRFVTKYRPHGARPCGDPANG